jgi:hypothetical protein
LLHGIRRGDARCRRRLQLPPNYIRWVLVLSLICKNCIATS